MGAASRLFFNNLLAVGEALYLVFLSRRHEDNMTSQYKLISPRRHATSAAYLPLIASACMLLVAVVSGCATTQPSPVINTVRVCAGEVCSVTGDRYTPHQMLHALDRLFQANYGMGFTFCKSDPATHQCITGDLGYFVLGGILPGRGSSSTGKVSQVKLDATNSSIDYVMSMDLRFLGIPLVCADHAAVLAVRSANDIAITDSAYACSWMVMGIMRASFSFVIDSVDFDQGQVGGYWKHGVTGTGNGRGRGYALIQFSKAMPRGENWLARQ